MGTDKNIKLHIVTDIKGKMTFHRLCCLRKVTSTLFWTSRYSTQAAAKVNKGLLTELRKTTGFSYVQCNKALKASDNDVQQAIDWLNLQAEKEGWVKAGKLESRVTNQGLVGVLVKDNIVALVQVACETDFVARDALFQELVATTAQATINYRHQVILENSKINSLGGGNTEHLRDTPHKIEVLPVANQNVSSLEEYRVSVVSQYKENIKLKKALAISTPAENIIGISSHGSISTTFNDCVMGTYCAAVFLKPRKEDIDRNHVSSLARSLSLHVIGMNPKCLTRCSNSDVALEDTLLGQEFLLDDSKCVGDLVHEAGVEVIDFVRYSIDD